MLIKQATMGLLRKSAGATMFLHVSLPLPQSPAHRETTAAHLTRRFEHKQQREFVENAERQELISIILVPRRCSWSKNGRSPWLDCWNFSLELGRERVSVTRRFEGCRAVSIVS
jgi:hypothetical protein